MKYLRPHDICRYYYAHNTFDEERKKNLKRALKSFKISELFMQDAWIYWLKQIWWILKLQSLFSTTLLEDILLSIPNMHEISRWIQPASILKTLSWWYSSFLHSPPNVWLFTVVPACSSACFSSCFSSPSPRVCLHGWGTC